MNEKALAAPKMLRAAFDTLVTSDASSVRTRSTEPEYDPIRSPYRARKAGVGTITPPAAPRPPRSRGRRTMPTIRKVTRGPEGLTTGAWLLTSAGLIESNGRRSPTFR